MKKIVVKSDFYNDLMSDREFKNLLQLDKDILQVVYNCICNNDIVYDYLEKQVKNSGIVETEFQNRIYDLIDILSNIDIENSTLE